eukprot:TRINITY_DN3136_c0_g1_i3.p1 TRINITY_DN3136_c0_g1~~TRINITY_DN3136_c0_g1_i3.p1  ORF type:complete len:214 (-),score=31.30 TRINITY_DN3136_c0_g1_i3:62-703(-)
MSLYQIEEQYLSCKKMVRELNSRLLKLDRGEDVTISNQGVITRNLESLNHSCIELNNQLRAIDDPSEVGPWSIKIQELSRQQKSMQNSFAKFFRKSYNDQKEREGTEEYKQYEKMYSDKDVDNIWETKETLDESHKIVDDLLDMAGSIYSTLHSDNITLKNVRTKVMDIANVLGVSNSVIRMIERRLFVDKLILYGGMLFILLLLIVAVYYRM